MTVERSQCLTTLTPGRDLDRSQQGTIVSKSDCVPVALGDPLYVFYASGTTGIHKGIVHCNGGHAVALIRSLFNTHRVRPREAFWAAPDIGWAVGHSFAVYGPLLCGCTTIMYEGKLVGNARYGCAFGRVIRDYGFRRDEQMSDRIILQPLYLNCTGKIDETI